MSAPARLTDPGARRGSALQRLLPASQLLALVTTCPVVGLASASLSAQARELELRPRLDTLLVASRADSTLQTLARRFFEEVQLLVPDLSTEQQELLNKAIEQGFSPAALRDDVTRSMSDSVSATLLDDLLARHRSGAIGEMRRLAEAHRPTQPLSEFIAALGTPPRDRLQLMVAFDEAAGVGTFDLLLEEVLQESAHMLVRQLGANLDPLQAASDEQFEVAYRQRALQLALANLQRLEPVPDELIRRAIEDLGSEGGRWYVHAYARSVSHAVHSAGARVAALTVESDTPPSTLIDPSIACAQDSCGFVVDWEGSEPTAFNSTFGAPGALEARVLENLLNAGYQLQRGDRPQGLTLRVRPRLMLARCEFMSGTDNTACVAIDNARVEFMGKYRDVANPGDLLVRNRCGSDGVLDVDNFARLVAMRIDYALTTTQGDRRQEPRC